MSTAGTRMNARSGYRRRVQGNQRNPFHFCERVYSMLIHVSPRFLQCQYSGPDVALVDVVIPELGLTLTGGKELTARRPYLNKKYLVACKREGQRAVEGILVETQERLDVFTVVTRWSIDAEILVKHSVQHHVLDSDFDVVTDRMILWYAIGNHGRTFSNRWPEVHQGRIPAHTQPRMDLTSTTRTGMVKDKLRKGLIEERNEIFHVPTVELGRLSIGGSLTDRLPTFASAFKIS